MTVSGVGGVKITPTVLGDVFRSLVISDDTEYRKEIQGAKEGVEQALRGVNAANRDFAVCLLAKCIQRETGISDIVLAEVAEGINGFVDGLVRANISQSHLQKKEETVSGIIDELRLATENTYKRGLDHIKDNPELLRVLVNLKVQNKVATPGFDNPFASADDLETAVIQKITQS